MNITSNIIKTILVAATVSFGSWVQSAAANPATEAAKDQEIPAAEQPQKADSQALTQATVKKIDVKQQKITLKHAAISNIGMPAMTMVFKVLDPNLLQGIVEGDEVLFAVEKHGSQLVVTQLQK